MANLVKKSILKNRKFYQQDLISHITPLTEIGFYKMSTIVKFTKIFLYNRSVAYDDEILLQITFTK